MIFVHTYEIHNLHGKLPLKIISFYDNKMQLNNSFAIAIIYLVFILLCTAIGTSFCHCVFNI